MSDVPTAEAIVASLQKHPKIMAEVRELLVAAERKEALKPFKRRYKKIMDEMVDLPPFNGLRNGRPFVHEGGPVRVSSVSDFREWEEQGPAEDPLAEDWR